MKKINIEGYAYFEGKPTQRKRHKLEVTFILDMVPGAFHEPEDIMNWICNNSYVDTVTLVTEPEYKPTEEELAEQMMEDAFRLGTEDSL